MSWLEGRQKQQGQWRCFCQLGGFICLLGVHICGGLEQAVQHPHLRLGQQTLLCTACAMGQQGMVLPPHFRAGN